MITVNPRSGFSLVEAMIAAIIIGVISVVALLSLVYCNNLAILADDRITAANFVRDTMEGLYRKGFGDAELNAAEDVEVPLPAEAEFGGKFLKKYPTAKRTYTVIDKGDRKVVKVKVRWTRP